MQSSRGVRGLSFTLVTPANHYPSRLPAFGDAPVVKLVTPRMAPSRIGEYLVSLSGGQGTVRPVEPGFETFLYGLEGEAAVLSGGDALALHAGGFAYLPGDLPAPGVLAGHRDDEPFADTDVPGFRRRELLPTTDPAFDFNMSLLAFDAGVGLDKVEIHDEEHGLYMTAGGGTYLLEDRALEVRAGDFIYMAPYCPQSFVAGDEPSEYLLYKDVWRDGF
jgi:(S)-ureidoglycine aminohydrolase